MKIIAFLFLVTVSTNLFAAKRDFEITCKKQDCFRYGWTMTEKSSDYTLDNKCMENDCEQRGWVSTDSNGDKFFVNCKNGGCFTEGWVSVNLVDRKVLHDQVSCKGGACLSYGWTVKTGYDLSGGNVTCGNFDCSKFGGVAFWRGKASKTVCKDWDCYTNGWYLTVY